MHHVDGCRFQWRLPGSFARARSFLRRGFGRGIRCAVEVAVAMVLGLANLQRNNNSASRISHGADQLDAFSNAKRVVTQMNETKRYDNYIPREQREQRRRGSFPIGRCQAICKLTRTAPKKRCAGSQEAGCSPSSLKDK